MVVPYEIERRVNNTLYSHHPFKYGSGVFCGLIEVFNDPGSLSRLGIFNERSFARRVAPRK